MKREQAGHSREVAERVKSWGKGKARNLRRRKEVNFLKVARLFSI